MGIVHQGPGGGLEGRRLRVLAQGEATQAQLLQPEARHVSVELHASDPDVEQPITLGLRRVAVPVDQELAGPVLPLEA